MTELIKDNKGQAIQVGSVVRYKTGWVRITRLNSKWCNLGAVWGSRIYEKKVPLTEIFEDEAAWYERWTQSESYRCM
jgi:hypothetical protein